MFLLIYQGYGSWCVDGVGVLYREISGYERGYENIRMHADRIRCLEDQCDRVALPFKYLIYQSHQGS